MLTKFEVHRAYKLASDKLLEYENTYNISCIKGDTLNHYEHLKAMSEYLVNSSELGATEVLLNAAEVDSLTRKID